MPTAPVAHRATAQRPTRAKPAVKPAAKRAPRQQDAVALLRADHKKVDGLFEDYKKARSVNVKRRLVETICRELTVHTKIEEEIFYPAVKIALKDKELVPEARVEHGSIKDLISKGVPTPKQYRSPMPPMGGAQLSDDDLNAVAAYVWAVGHPKK